MSPPMAALPGSSLWTKRRHSGQIPQAFLAIPKAPE